MKLILRFFFYKMKKFSFHKVLDGLTSSPSGNCSSSSSGSGPGRNSGEAAGTPRDEIQERLTADYFQICKVRAECFL